MLRLILSVRIWLIAVATSVFAATLVVGTESDTPHHRVRAQASIQFGEGYEIYRLVYENVAAGGPVGAPVTASGGTGDLTYSLSGTDAASFSIGESAGQILVGRDTSFDYESGKTTYRVVITATDESGQAASADVVVTVENVDEPPEFRSSGVEAEVAENTAANTNIGDSITAEDPEGDDVTYSLTGADAVLFAIDASSGQIKSKASLNYEITSEYAVTFTASDPQSNSASIDVTITVLDDDTEAPGTPAKPSVVPNPGNGHEALKVSWTAPENAGPVIMTYLVQYRIEGSGDEWDDSSVSGTYLEVTLSELKSSTTYKVQVRALNDEGESPWSETGVGQTLAAPPANSAPDFDAGAVTALTVAENTSTDTAIGAPFVASDADSLDTLAYSLSGVDSALFAVGASTGQITVGAGTTLDYESPADSGRDNVYDVVVQVSDGKDAAGTVDTSVDDTIAITITVTDVNEPPEYGSTEVRLEVDENTSPTTNVGDPLKASDPESDVLTYSLTGADSALFTISSSNGQISIGDSTDLDHESPSDVGQDNTYDLTVRVSDGKDDAGNSDTTIDDSISVTITVNDVDEPPRFDVANIEIGVAENTATNTNIGDPTTAVDPEGRDITYSLNGTAAGLFDVDASTGQVKTKAPLNYEAANTHSISFTASDPQSNRASIGLTITVTDDDTEAPGRPAKPAVAPNPGNGHEAIKVTWTVPENNGPAISGYVVQHRIDGSTDSWTQVAVAASGANTVISDLEATTAFEVQVRADNAEGEGTWSESGKGETLAEPVMNSPPEFDDGATTALSIDENALPGSDVGPPVTATDPDQSDALAYSLLGTDSALFSVDGSTGQIRVGLETVLDFESPADTNKDGVYEVTVQVTDGKDSDGNDDTSVDDSTNVKITVTDVNEQPEFDAPTLDLNVEENTSANTGIGDPITATDPESDVLEYSLSGDDSGLFDVDDSSGQVSIGLATVLDHESPGDANGDNVYEVTLNVSDGKDEAGNVDTSADDAVDVTITVTDLNEPPGFGDSVTELSLAENTTGNTGIGDPIAAVDPESDGLIYSLVGADSRWFEIDTSSGQVKTKAVLDYEDPFDSNSDNVYEFSTWVTDGLDEEGQPGNAVDDSVDVTIRVADVNEPPVFDSSSIALEVDENAAPNTAIGSPIVAADPESDTLTYSLAGADSSWFAIDASAGQIKSKVLLDHESPLDADGDNVYELSLNVSDGKDEAGNADAGTDATINVSIAVRGVNEPPAFGSAAFDLTIVENAKANTKVGSPVTADDPESDTLVYTLTGADSGHFDIESSTGQLRVGAGTTFDIEVPSDADSDNVHQLVVQVSDGVDADGNPNDSVDGETIVRVTVTDVNEAPTFDAALVEIEVAENLEASSAVDDPITATDPESASLTYSLSGADSGLFEIGPRSGQVTVGVGTILDYESPADSNGDNVYEMVVSVTDSADEDGIPDKNVDATFSLSITVTDINERPEFGVSLVQLEVAENTEASAVIGDPVSAVDAESGLLTYSLSGDDSGLFAVDGSNGQISIGVDTFLDFESPADLDGNNVFELIVQVTDGLDEDGNVDDSVDAEIVVNITVTDVNETPEFELAAVLIEVMEGTEANMHMGDPIPANDPELAELTYSLAGVDADLFQFDPLTAMVKVGDNTTLDFESPSDHDGDNSYVFLLRVADNMDEDGHGDNAIDAEIPVTIEVTDINEPPEFEGLYVRVAVEENTPASTNVGDPVLAVDQEMDELTYSLAGSDADLFEVDPSTGQISIGAETLLDFESPSDSNGDNVYELVARVSDGKGEDGEVDTLIDGETGVIISVTNVHEPGDAVSSTVQMGVQENAPANTAVGAPVRAEGSEPAELTYSLDGDDSAWFDIESKSGQITTSIEFDYELPVDANGDNVYEMTAQVTDGTDAEGNADPSVDKEIGVMITIYDINEPPVAAAVFSDRTLPESDGLQQSDVSSYFSDPEGDVLTYAATSSDSRVAAVGIAGATLAIAPTGPGTATVEVTATDPGQLSFSQSFVVNVVPAQVGSGGFFPIYPPFSQETGGTSGAGTDQTNLLSERDVLVVPRAVSLLPGEAVSMHAIAFNLLGDALPAGTAGVVCTWSSDGDGIFMPNGTSHACTTTFTAPPAGSGNIVVRVTQGRIAAVGSAVYEVPTQETMRSGLGSEVAPGLEFPAGVTGSVVWREDGASITTPNGLTMRVPAGAIDADFLGVYVREVPVTDVVLPGNSGFTVGSYAGDFSFVDDAGDPMPGFHTQVPVRICLPITQEDLDAVDGGIDGVHVVHVTDDGEYVRHPSESDLNSMMTCADVDDFSIYFVGLAIESPEPMAAPTPTPAPSSTSTPIPAATPAPVHTPTPVPAEVATPILPSAGDAKPGARGLVLVTMVAVAAVAAGVVLLRRTGLATPSR